MIGLSLKLLVKVVPEVCWNYIKPLKFFGLEKIKQYKTMLFSKNKNHFSET